MIRQQCLIFFALGLAPQSNKIFDESRIVLELLVKITLESERDPNAIFFHVQYVIRRENTLLDVR